MSRTLNLLLGSAYTRLPTVVCSRFARQANIRRAEALCHWKARARRRKAAGAYLLSVRRVPPWIAYPCGTQTRAGSRRKALSARTNGQAGGLRLLFVLFFAERKEHVSLLFKGERYVLFSAGRKDTKRAVEAIASNSHPSVGKHIHTAPNRRNRAPTCALRHSPCGKHLRLGSLRLQAQSCRSALSVRTNDRTERTRFLFVLFLSAQEKDTFHLCQRRKAPKDQSISFKEIYTHLKRSNQFKLRHYAMLCIAGQRRAESTCGWEACARRRKARAA